MAAVRDTFLPDVSLTFPLIAGSLLLTNLSTEQMVGLNGSAFTDGLCVMVWEVVCVVALVFMAWFFLPRFLKSGVATVPQYLEIRFDHQTQIITNLIFLVAYVGILLPIILYTGATGMIGILDVPSMLGGLPDALGMDADTTALWLIVWAVGIIGSIYALFGGLRTVAVSDTLNGIGLLVGGFLITAFALSKLGGESGMGAGLSLLLDEQRERFNSVGSAESSVPFGTIFSGIFLLNLFYWTTNQQIIQRTFGASSLAEGQKGVLLTGALKLLGPLYLVIPGMIAYSVFAGQEIKADKAYGMLVNDVLPGPLTGFFAAAMIGRDSVQLQFGAEQFLYVVQPWTLQESHSHGGDGIGDCSLRQNLRLDRRHHCDVDRAVVGQNDEYLRLLAENEWHVLHTDIRRGTCRHGLQASSRSRRKVCTRRGIHGHRDWLLRVAFQNHC